MQGPGQGKTDPERASAENSLGRCLFDGDPAEISSGRRKRRRAFGISLVIESVILASLVVSPLLFSVAKPQINRMPPPMPITLGAWRSSPPRRNTAQIHDRSTGKLPDAIFRPTTPGPILNSQENPEFEPIPGESRSMDDFRGAIPIENPGPPPPNLEPGEIVHKPTLETRPEKISEGVLQGQLISRIEPRYPVLAVQTRREGTVMLHAIISREGRITALEVVSGSPLFLQAALDAVRQWRYRPTMLNGEPVEVDTSITVIFRLNR